MTNDVHKWDGMGWRGLRPVAGRRTGGVPGRVSVWSRAGLRGRGWRAGVTAAVCAVLTGAVTLPATADSTAAGRPGGRQAAAVVSQTFTFTGAPQTLTVPAGMVVAITADGAGGADYTGKPCLFLTSGGTGARVVTTLPPSASPTTYTVNVGGTGAAGCNQSGTGGFNGGAPGGSASGPNGARQGGSGGGGASSVSTGTSLLVVAGGGGGAGGPNAGAGITGGDGGNGGTPDATAGTTGASLFGGSPGGGGQGGSTTTMTGGTGGAPGSPHAPCTATAGGPGSGFTGAAPGTGGAGGNSTACITAGAGGGGGGGYFAGGGGGGATDLLTGASFANGGGGGGGSSFATPSGTGTSFSASTIGTANHNGQVIISYAPPAPSLTIGKSHSGSFVRGQSGSYTITVGNNGTGSTDGSTVTVTDTLPAGLTGTALSGTGWSCTLATLTCTRSDVLAAGASYPPLILTVDVACTAPDGVTNTASVSGGASSPDTVTDPTSITGACPPSLTISKHHTGYFEKGRKGTYTLTVANNGSGPTSGTVTVTDTLPPQLRAVSISGTGWTCTLATPTCTRSDVLDPGSSYPPITITVKVSRATREKVADTKRGGSIQVINTATVTGGGSPSDTATDPTTIRCHKGDGHHSPKRHERHKLQEHTSPSRR